MNFITSLIKSAKKTYSAVQKWKAFANSVKPEKPFDSNTVPAPFDYSSMDCWAAHPEKPSKALMTPEGSVVGQAPEADVFYIHPTTYFGKGNWNQPLSMQPATELVSEMVMPAQASVFNESCRIFAPRYRQATFYVFLKDDENSSSALQLAYDDVVSAFKYYLKHHNHGRPFFIAGHSQGSLHAVRLLEEVIDSNQELRKRMVAAYPIGFQLPMDKFTRTFKNIRPSAQPTDLQTIIAWDTYGEDTNPKNPIDRCRYYYKDSGKWEMRYKKKNFGVNPMTFSTAAGVVDAAHHKGAVHVVYKRPFRFDDWWKEESIGIEAVGLSKPMLAEVSAELRGNQFVYISEPKNRQFKLAMLPGKNYHNYDYSLFYMSLRENIKLRLETYLNQG